MRQIEEEDDTPATCPEDSNLTTLNVNCRGVIGRGDGIPGENGIPGVISNLDCNNHNMVMKRKTNSSTLLNTSTINTTGTIHTSAPPPVPPPTTTTNSTTNMRKTKRSPNERRFKCDQCDRMFFTRKDVKRHLVVHTGVRNYACPFCQQRFGRKDHLVRHAKKSHQKDTRASASSNNIAVSPPPVGSTTNSPINHHHRRLTFTHSQVHHHGLPGAPNLNHHHPGRMMVNVNNNIHNNNNTNGSGNNNANLSPCNYSSNLTNIQLDPPSSIMLLGPSPNGSINGSNGNSNSNVSAPLTNCSPNGTNGINSVNGNSGINNNHHDICYPGNTNHHNGSMASSINDGHFGTPTTMGHHSSLCETPLFNNGGHYFSLGTGPTPFMNPAYITNCFGHITVNPGNTGAQVLTSVPTMCSTDQPNSVSCTNALSHLDVNHLHHFNQVFQ